MFSLGPGRAPASELAHWAMLGYTPEEFPGRAVLEATGAEQEIDPGHVFAFAALRPAERRDDGLWLTGRPRRGEDEEDSAELVAACDGLEVDGAPVRARSTCSAARRSCACSRARTIASRTRTPSSRSGIRC